MKKRLSWLDGVLMACEGNIDAKLGDVKSWNGLAALHLFNEIRFVHGRLFTRHDSREFLEKALITSEKNKHKLIWDSMFIRALCLSAMGDLDTGIFHTRKPLKSE